MQEDIVRNGIEWENLAASKRMNQRELMIGARRLDFHGKCWLVAIYPTSKLRSVQPTRSLAGHESSILKGSNFYDGNNIFLQNYAKLVFHLTYETFRP
jgi:hypothetical protein